MEEIKVNESIASNNVFWLELVKTIYKSYSISYVVNKGKKYINCSNRWFNADELREKIENMGITIAHKDHECTGYFSDECNVKSKINKRQVLPQEIKYVFNGKFNYDVGTFDESWSEHSNDKYNTDFNEVLDNKLKKEVKKMLLSIEKKNQSSDASNIKFIFNKKIQMYNLNGINTDHRGSDHMVIKLPFESNVNFENEFTLEELIVGCMTLKSHKFNLWYELFYDAICEKIDDHYKINLNFDHGS